MREVAVIMVRHLLALLTSASLSASGFAASQNCFPDGVIVNGIAVVDTSQGLQGIELRSGKSLWTEPRNGIPLEAYDGAALVAAGAANEFRIIIVDAASGAIRQESEPIRLGHSAPSRPPRFNEITASVSRTTATIEWTASPDVTGTYRSGFVDKRLMNLVDIDLQTDRISPIRTVSKQEAPPSAPYMRFGQWANTAWQMPNGSASLELVSNDRLALAFTPKNGTQKETILPRSGSESPPIVSDDGALLLLASKSHAPTLMLFSVLTHRLIGNIAVDAAVTSACLHDANVYMKVVGSGEPVLMAVDTRTLKVVWQRTLPMPNSRGKSAALPQ